MNHLTLRGGTLLRNTADAALLDDLSLTFDQLRSTLLKYNSMSNYSAWGKHELHVARWALRQKRWKCLL